MPPPMGQPQIPGQVAPSAGAPAVRPAYDPATQTDHLFGGLPGVADASTGGKAAPGNIVDYILGKPAGTTDAAGAQKGGRGVGADRSGRAGFGASATPTTMEGYAPGMTWIPSTGSWMMLGANGRPIA
jgi:hypothetical protein